MHLYFSVLFVFALTRASSCVMPGGRTGWRLCGRAYTHMASVPCVSGSVLSARLNGRTSTRSHPMSSGMVFHLRTKKKVKKCAAFLHSLHILYISLCFVCLWNSDHSVYTHFQCFLCSHLQRLQFNLIFYIMVCRGIIYFRKLRPWKAVIGCFTNQADGLFLS